MSASPVAIGACLQLLRVEAGLSLRELGARLGVSSAYLSRVEHGRDPPPTTDRLAAFADAVGLSRAVVFELVRGPTATAARYLEARPAARALVQDLARLELDDAQLDAVRVFAATLSGRGAQSPATAALPLEPGRVLLNVACATVDDAVDLALSRLRPPPTGWSAPDLVGLGGGVALARLVGSGALELSLVTTRQPVAGPRGDARAVIAASSAQRGHLILAHAAARWASGGLADALAGVASPAEAIRIAQRLAD